MTDFKTYSDNDIKQWLLDNKVCIVTNSITHKGSLFPESFKTYCNFVTPDSFSLIPGFFKGEPHYGFQAFITMLNSFMPTNIQYILYIDEDCFITDFRGILHEFEIFMQGDYCLAGVQDGGVVCHRNHSSILINTFISFWNLGVYRPCIKQISNAIRILEEHKNTAYEIFINNLKIENMFDSIMTLADNQIKLAKDYRDRHFDHELPHAIIVKNDPTNVVEPNQIPYSSNNAEKTNYEPYYTIEEAILIITKKPIYYLFGVDLYCPDKEDFDNSGLSSTVIDRESEQPLLYHTWWSRGYDSTNTTNEKIIENTKRINSILRHI